MPDIKDLAITQQGSGQARTWRVACAVVDSESQQTVLHDFTGGKAILFPAAFLALPDADQRLFLEDNAIWLIQKLAPEAFA